MKGVYSCLSMNWLNTKRVFGSIDERDPSPPLTVWIHHELSSFWCSRLDFVQIFPQSPFDQPLCRRGTGFKFHLSPTSNSSNSLHHLTGDGSSPREGALLFAQQSWWQYWNQLLWPGVSLCHWEYRSFFCSAFFLLQHNSTTFKKPISTAFE